MATTRAKTEAKTGDSIGDWQTVRRRKPFPTNWRSSQPSPPIASPYQPYSKPTYAQVLRRSPPTNTMTIAGQISPISTQPASPTSHTSSAFYVSPHSPSRLRFPPSHTFPEWKGRCFRCCRTGHSAAKCRNPKRCGKCWSFGHIGSKCKQEIVPPPLPQIRTTPKPFTAKKAEPNFDELLTGSYPYRSPEMPKERPTRLHCFIARDDEYYAEIERLKQAVVLHTGGFELSVDNVCDYACQTKLVTKEEIQISELSGSRFLILLPEGLDPDTFINATPQSAWDEGLSFQPWTPLEDAAISIPAYKILLSLVGIPPHIFKEKHVAQAVCHFGVFLGSVAPEKPSSLASWMVAVGVDDLSLVPPELVVHVGGMVHPIRVQVIDWRRAPIYTADEMPKQPKKYHRPQPPPPSSSSSDNETMQDDTELIPMSTQVLREICRGKTADSLPPELRRFATIEVMDMAHPHMPTQAHATADQPASGDTNFDPPAIIQGLSQNVQGTLEWSADRLWTDSVSFPIVGQEQGNFDQHEERHITSRHIPSPVILPLVVQPKQKGGGKEGNVAPQTAVLSLHETSQIQPSHKLPRSDHQKSKSQKILLRGDSSKSVLTTGGGSESARIKSLIFSENNAVSKITADRARGSNQGVIIAETVFPISQEFPLKGKVSKERQPGIIFQAKGKAQDGGPISNGPYARKYKWTRPVSNNAQITKKIIAASGSKRKNPTCPPPGQTKKTSSKRKEKDLADVSFNSEGFYEVKVHYEHVSKLAAGCGFKTEDVEKVIQKDNAQRQLQASHQQNLTKVSEDEDPDLSRFELDPNDELTSEEEEDA